MSRLETLFICRLFDNGGTSGICMGSGRFQRRDGKERKK